MNTCQEGNFGWTKIIILTGATIICFILKFYIIASVAVYLIMLSAKISIQNGYLRQLKQNLFKREGKKKEFIIKDSLQYLKSCRMIYYGYDYRSNTNIIIQQQRENKEDRALTEEESLIYQKICRIYEQTVQIISKVEKILSIAQKCLPQIKIKIDCFEDIFTANKQFQTLLIHQNYLIDMAEDTVNSISPGHNFAQKVKQLIKIIPQINKRQQSFIDLQNINENIFRRNIKQEYQQYYDFFVGRDNSQKCQNVSKWIDSLSNTIKNEETQSQIDKGQLFLYDDPSLNTQLETITFIQIKQPKQHNIVGKKAQFLKKLDTLLMIGMMRKRQQAEEKKICHLEENQSQID